MTHNKAKKLIIISSYNEELKSFSRIIQIPHLNINEDILLNTTKYSKCKVKFI